MSPTPTLYLMLGYPGAGKTTTAQILRQLTSAKHLWADLVRRQTFVNPTHSHDENLKLYKKMNIQTKRLLGRGESVIFDTNFNFYKDREKLRLIAKQAGAKALIIWVRTPKEIAKARATTNAHKQGTRVLGDMPAEEFDRMSNNLQEPRPDEKVIEIDGTKVTENYIRRQLIDLS